MTVQDIKLTILNSTVAAITFLTNAEIILKILLLIVSIVYTGFKAYELYITKIRKKNGSNNIEENSDSSSED